jgi:hypothetical protein
MGVPNYSLPPSLGPLFSLGAEICLDPARHGWGVIGVARISHGPGPYRAMANWLEAAARNIYSP